MPNKIQCYQLRNKNGDLLNGLEIQTSWNILDFSKKENPYDAVSKLVELMKPTRLIISRRNLDSNESTLIGEAFRATVWNNSELLITEKQIDKISEAVKLFVQKSFDLDIRTELVITTGNQGVVLTVNDNGQLFIVGSPSVISNAYIKECQQHLGKWIFKGHF